LSGALVALALARDADTGVAVLVETREAAAELRALDAAAEAAPARET